MQFETRQVPLDDLSLHHKNPRVGNVDVIAESLKVNGQYRAIVVNVGTITGRPMEVLAGNHTVKAARLLGWDMIMAHLLDVDEDAATRIVLADNRTSDLGDIDDELLALLANSLDSLAGTGYTSEDLALLEPDTDIELLVDDADSVPDETVVRAKVGDVWELGNHLVACGKAEDPAVYDRLLGDSLADAVWTDPPYGVDYEGKTKKKLTIKNDGSGGLVRLLEGAFTNLFQRMRPGAPIYVAHSDKEGYIFHTQFRQAGFSFRQNLMWVKNGIVIGRGDYHYQHEPVLYGFKPAPAGSGRLGRGGDRWFGGHDASTVFDAVDAIIAAREGEGPDRAILVDTEKLAVELENCLKETTVFRHAKPAASREHPTMKPVSLVTDMLKNSATRGYVVLDPFGGSGTTLIACELLGLHARMIELDPKYVDVIITRWEEATGGDARRIVEGE